MRQSERSPQRLLVSQSMPAPCNDRLSLCKDLRCNDCLKGIVAANPVQKILRNESYIGNIVFNRISYKLQQRTVVNPPEMCLAAPRIAARGTNLIRVQFGRDLGRGPASRDKRPENAPDGAYFRGGAGSEKNPIRLQIFLLSIFEQPFGRAMFVHQLTPESITCQAPVARNPTQ